MNRILVLSPPEDRSGRAINLASELASRTGARLTLVRVLEEGIRWEPQRRARDRGREIRDLLVKAETRELENLAAPHLARGVEIDLEISWGVTWEVVVQLVEAEAFDLVVKPARGLNRSGRVFFGATALHLFRKCPCPVWVVGDDGRPPEMILAAIDPSEGPTRRSVAERILCSANSLGECLDSPVHVATAWHGPAMQTLEGRVERDELEAYREDHRRRCAEALDLVLRQASPGTGPERRHLIEGFARDVIPPFAEDNDFDLIVIGTLGRTGIPGELLGETAEMILRDVRCSVLAISPSHKSLVFE